MSDAVIVAVVTGACAVISQFVVSHFNNQKLFDELKRQSEITDTKLEGKLETLSQVTDTKITELTREVRAHNDFAKRMPVLEEKVTQLEHRVS
jgi:polyhydroxyalkanoate synthesis regulator phasin